MISLIFFFSFFFFQEVLKKQKETKTKEGKRRIVPIMLEQPNEFEYAIHLSCLNLLQMNGVHLAFFCLS